MWKNKYMPQTNRVKDYETNGLNDIIGNNENMCKIKEWLKTFGKNEYSNLLLIGPHGSGKTYISNIILKEFGYNINFINFNNITHIQIKDYINTLIKGNDISLYINKGTSIKQSLIIDEIETITSTIEKKVVLELNKYNHLHKVLPIIFVANTQHNKIITKLKKYSLCIDLTNLNYDESDILLDKIIKCEHMTIALDAKKQIIEYAQGDSRRLIQILQMLYNMYGTMNITVDIINNFLLIIQKKDINIGLYESTQLLLNKFLGMDQTNILYDVEKTNLSLMMHDHYLYVILLNFSNNNKIKVLKKISDSISYSDTIEHYVYNAQMWDLQYIHGYFSCTTVSYYLNSVNKKSNKISLKFTEDLSKTSIRNINRKNITNIKSKFENANIYDYIYMNHIVKSLINNNKLEECANLLSDYNVSINNINTLIKIDKIKHSKNAELTSKNKKIFNNYLTV